MNTIFVAQSHRENVTVHLVLESTKDFSRTITFDSNEITNIGGFHESALLSAVVRAVDASQGMTKEQTRQVEPGITVRTMSFEKLVKELAEDPCFLLTDHIPMPKKSYNSLKRLGTEKISLGPNMLFASQCVVLINNEMDIRGF